MKSTIEIWRDIKDYEGYYQVSNLGNVKSINRKIVLKNNKTMLIKERILKQSIGNNNYLIVSLFKNGNGHSFTVHRLVAEAFIPNPDNLPEVNHKNENKTDNCVDNLEWCTSKYNCNYGNKMISKIKSVAQYTKNNILINIFRSTCDAEKQTGISNSHISACCNGKYGFKSAGGYIWKYV